MNKRKLSFGTLVGIVAVVAIAGGIAAGFGLFGDDTAALKPTLTGESTDITGTQNTPRARPRGVAGKPYAQLITDGAARLRGGDLEGALGYFQEAARTNPKESVPYEKVGDVFALQGKYAQAAESYRFGFELSPTNRSIFIKRIRSLLNARKISEAQSSLAKVQTQSPEVTYLNALVFSFYNDQQKAREGFSNLIKLADDKADPMDPTPLSDLKTKATTMNQMYESFDLANEAPLSYLQALLAKAYDSIGEYGLAIETAFAGLKIQNDYRDVWIILGHAFLKTNQWFDAEDALTKALALDQRHPSSFFYRGLARMRLKKIREAIADFSSAIELGYKPKIEATLQLGDAYYVLGDGQKALTYYKEVLTTDARSLELFKKPISLVLFSNGNAKIAAELIDLAVANHPDSALPYAWKSIVRTSQGDLNEARTLYEKAASLDKQQVYVTLAQAELQRAVGNASDAEASYGRILDESTSEDDVLIKQYATRMLDSLDSSFSLSLE